MITMDYDHTNPRIVHNGKINLLDYFDPKLSKIDSLNKHINYFEMNLEEINYYNNEYMDSNTETTEDGRHFISYDIIKALCTCLKDYSTAVRDTAASSLGQIGLPEAANATYYLVEAFKDEDVNVKSKAIWALGRLAPGIDNSVIPYIVDALKSGMWKIKSACLYSLSCFGSRASKLALPVLLKLLKESAINKQTIAETMVRLGNDGESALLKLMTNENDSNYKLKSSIAKALALSNINSSNIDFILETLFKSANSQIGTIRQNAFFALRVLAEKAEEKITYLKRKNIIPFYYEKMNDKEVTIQAVILFLIII
jgi:HEAT repeat protein